MEEKQLSENTKQQYSRCLAKLTRCGVEHKDSEKVFEWFEKENMGMSSRKTYLCALRWKLKENCPVVYGEKVREYMNAIREDYLRNKVTIKGKRVVRIHPSIRSPTLSSSFVITYLNNFSTIDWYCYS